MTLQESLNTGIEITNTVDKGIKYALNSNAGVDGGSIQEKALEMKKTWPIRYFFKKWACFKSWEPMRYETYEELGMARFAKYVNYLIKFGVAFITLIMFPIVPWIFIMYKSWRLFRKNVLYYIFGPLGKNYWRQVLMSLFVFAMIAGSLYILLSKEAD